MNNDVEKLINYNNFDFRNFNYSTGTKTISLNMDYIQTMTLKKYIEFTYKCDTSWIYKSNSILNFSFLLDKCIKINGKNINYKTNIVFTNHNFSKLSITSYSDEIIKEDYIKKAISKENKLLSNEIKDLCDKIKKSSIEENYFFEAVQLCYGSIVGYYDFDHLVVDGGAKVDSYDKPEIMKLKIKYSKVILDDMPVGTPVCDSMMIDRDIVKKLLQLIIRFPIENRVSDGKYYSRDDFYATHNFELDKSNIGNCYSVDRNKIIDNNYFGFPNDTKTIIDKFYSIDYEKKNAFIKSCTCYINGLNSDSTKAVSYYVLAIENLANFNSKPSQTIPKQGKFYEKMIGNKKDLIYKEINNIYGKEMVSDDYINILYRARSSHVHDGLENNDILETVLGIDEHNKTLIDSAERLAHSFLIKWLLID